ncbi:MAG: hypothetical protein AAGA56_06920 [Myxococcota bacterium]
MPCRGGSPSAYVKTPIGLDSALAKTNTTHIKHRAAALPLLSSLACGGAIGEQIRPEEQRATDALGVEAPECSGVADHARPLIVDWDPDSRVDLEAAMKGGIVVVQYNCDRMTVLPGCGVPDGTYEYAGVSRKEQVVQMSSQDDLHANIPVSSAKLGAEIKSGRSIDVALVMVGKRSTTVSEIERGGLKGRCDDATHFVRSASVGAFSMATGSQGKAAAVAEMFGFGGGAKSESERKALNRDGSLDACRTSDPSSATPPGECQAPIRLQLVPIGETRSAAAKGDKKEKDVTSEPNPCPEGYVFVDEICTAGSDKPYLCNPDNEPECKTQCARGNADSCLNYGNIVRRKNRAKGVTKSYGAAMPFYKKACDGDVADGCAALALATEPDTDHGRVAELAKASLAYAIKACDLGSAIGCENAGDMVFYDSYRIMDQPRAVKLYLKGCNLGRGIACWSAAQGYFGGKGVGKDGMQGVKLLVKACSGGSVDECNDAANVFAKGQYGVPKKPDLALKLNLIACRMDKDYCGYAGVSAAAVGDEALAAKLFAKACDEAKDGESCLLLGDAYEDGRGVNANADRAKSYWAKGCQEYEEAACKKAGLPVPE